MKHITSESQININGLSFCLNTDPNNHYTWYVEILNRIVNQLTAMLTHHNKVLIIRLDLHMNAYTPNNKLVSTFLHKLKKVLARKYKHTHIGHLWVREQEIAQQQHYHLALMIDGSRMRHPHALIKLVEELWQTMSQPKPFTPKNCYLMVSRDDKAAFAETFHRLSYFAKVRGKGRRPKSSNDFSASRIHYR